MRDAEELESWMIECIRRAVPDPRIKGFQVDLDTMTLMPRYTSRIEAALQRDHDLGQNQGPAS